MGLISNTTCRFKSRIESARDRIRRYVIRSTSNNSRQAFRRGGQLAGGCAGDDVPGDESSADELWTGETEDAEAWAAAEDLGGILNADAAGGEQRADVATLAAPAGGEFVDRRSAGRTRAGLRPGAAAPLAAARRRRRPAAPARRGLPRRRSSGWRACRS